MFTKEINSVVKNLPTIQIPNPDSFLGEYTKHLKKK